MRTRAKNMQTTAIRKMVTLLLVVCFTSACNADSEIEIVNESEILVPESEVLDYQKSAIAQSITDTPYSALIQVTSVDIVNLPDDDKTDDYSEKKFIYHANVIETFRGEGQSKITYVMYAEDDETPGSYEKPFIVTLCHADDEGFYWPGVGSEFLGHSQLRELAKKAAKKADKKQVKFILCD